MAAAQTWADGAEIILEALRRQPGNLDLRGQLFEIYIKMGHLEAAQKVVDEMVRRDPLEPRNSYLAGTVARLKGEFQQAYDLTEQAISRGFSQFMGEAHLACDLMYLGEAAALDELLGPEWTPNAAFPVDPRRVLASRSDPALRQAVAAEFEALVAEGDRTVMRNLVGYSCSVLFEFGDADLTRRAAQRLADVMGRGEMVPIFWQARHRGDWGSHVLDIEIWQEHWIDFWERIGPPDGCAWDGERLACDWEESASAIQTAG